MTQIMEMLKEAREDSNWFGEHLEEFKNKYDNQFIAFQKKKVIDADPDLKSLLKKLKDKHINTSQVFIEFVSKVERILGF